MMERHPEAFGSDFEQNKKALEDLALIPSKQLRNRIAGYIAKSLKLDSTEEAETPSEEQKE
jgi:small subunit ribosomal protein S17e